MNGNESDSRKIDPPNGNSPTRFGVLGAVCALVIGVFTYTAHSGFDASRSLSAADNYYNLLVQGFRAGHLSLRMEVPVGLTKLVDPYDPASNAQYPVIDMSYYKGKLYLYYGVTPAVLLFWPFVALTGHYLPQKDAVVFFCIIGFLVSVAVLYAIWRRFFARVSVAIVATGALALGLATCTPPLLARCDVWEVAISCGYAFAMLATGAIWRVLNETESRKRSRWLAAASLAYGLAVGARPCLAFGAVILLIPVVLVWRERKPVWGPLIAALGPIAVIGFGLMIYNWLRFDNPLEFGLRYALARDQHSAQPQFGWEYLWPHLRVYLLEVASWSGRFRFVKDYVLPLPVVHGNFDDPFGVLTNIPVVWLALAVPLAWRGRPVDSRSTLRAFLAAAAVLFGTTTLILSLHYSVSIRYEVDFLPALVLLAVIGILSVDDTLSARTVWRSAARWCWSLLLCLSVAFNLLASVRRCATSDFNFGVYLMQIGRVHEAEKQFEMALRLSPDSMEVHYNYASDLMKLGKFPEAAEQFEQVLRMDPTFANANLNLGVALQELGKTDEAIAQYEQALRLNPDYIEAHLNLGAALEKIGRADEAVDHYEKASKAIPGDTAMHVNLGNIFLRMGKMPEAVGEYEQVLRINPGLAEAHSNLGAIFQRMGKLPEAVAEYELALQGKPDYVEAHFNLGLALEKLGRTPEAIQHYQQAFELRPEFAAASNALARLQANQ